VRLSGNLLEFSVLPLTYGRIAVKSGGVENKKRHIVLDSDRPGANALVGDFFIDQESPSGSIFLLAGAL
jgi:hypothetical protein